MSEESFSSMLLYYCNQTDKYAKYFVDFTTEFDKAKSIIKFYKNNKLTLSSYYQYLGKYSQNDNIWLWGWADEKYLDKNAILYTKKIFDYGFNINLSLDKDKEEIFKKLIKELLITSIFKIQNIKLLLIIAYYITKAEYISVYPDSKDPNILIFILLKDIETFN